MGTNICVYNADHEKHSTWDNTRYAHDNDFLRLVAHDERVYLSENWYTDFTYGFFKLKHPGVIREIIRSTGWDYQERYLELVDIVSDSEWYIYIDN